MYVKHSYTLLFISQHKVNLLALTKTIMRTLLQTPFHRRRKLKEDQFDLLKSMVQVQEKKFLNGAACQQQFSFLAKCHKNSCYKKLTRFYIYIDAITQENPATKQTTI